MKLNKINTIYVSLNRADRIQFWTITTSCFVSIFTFFIGLVYGEFSKSGANTEWKEKEFIESYNSIVEKQKEIEQSIERFGIITRKEMKFGNQEDTFKESLIQLAADAKQYCNTLTENIKLFNEESQYKIKAYNNTVLMVVKIIDMYSSLTHYDKESITTAFYEQNWNINNEDYDKMSSLVHQVFSKADPSYNIASLGLLLISSLNEEVNFIKEGLNELRNSRFTNIASIIRVTGYFIGLIFIGFLIWLIICNIVFSDSRRRTEKDEV